LTDALFSTVVSLSNGRFDVIADTVFEREDFAAMQVAFADRTYRLVAVTAPLHVLEEREQARGNRRIGQARDQQARVLQNASYDLRVDTHALTLDECVDRVVALLPSSER
jgi:chloramphenicol 3-O phosphotransferase